MDGKARNNPERRPESTIVLAFGSGEPTLDSIVRPPDWAASGVFYQ
jgi:hypothetical protein